MLPHPLFFGQEVCLAAARTAAAAATAAVVVALAAASAAATAVCMGIVSLGSLADTFDFALEVEGFAGHITRIISVRPLISYSD